MVVEVKHLLDFVLGAFAPLLWVYLEGTVLDWYWIFVAVV
jgi:hypothetical protein